MYADRNGWVQVRELILGGFFMPKNKVQEVIFTILMVFVMVYAMICYNIAMEITSAGIMTNVVFLTPKTMF